LSKKGELPLLFSLRWTAKTVKKPRQYPVRRTATRQFRQSKKVRYRKEFCYFLCWVAVPSAGEIPLNKEKRCTPTEATLPANSKSKSKNQRTKFFVKVVIINELCK
jgi:hypothetical protein